MNRSDVLDVKSAAAILEVSIRRVQRLVEDGKLQATWFNRSHMIDRKEVEAYKKRLSAFAQLKKDVTAIAVRRGKDGKPFQLPAEKLAEKFETTKHAVWNVIKSLLGSHHLELVSTMPIPGGKGVQRVFRYHKEGPARKMTVGAGSNGRGKRLMYRGRPATEE